MHEWQLLILHMCVYDHKSDMHVHDVHMCVCMCICLYTHTWACVCASTMSVRLREDRFQSSLFSLTM